MTDRTVASTLLAMRAVLPLALTLFRLIAVPIFVWRMIEGDAQSAFVIFLLAGFSDALDGALARSWNARTRLGALLDPIADKLLMLSAYLLLGRAGRLPAWLVGLVIGRDLAIVSGALFGRIAGRRADWSPLPIAKLATALQVGLAAWMLLAAGYALPLPDASMHSISTLLIGLTALVTLASGVAYARRWYAAFSAPR